MSSINAEICMQKLWSHIIKSHYEYLAEDEGLKMIDKRNTLEKQLKHFLSLVQQDRKFFLPVTRHVLRETIRTNADCSMHSTGMGFVAIHQYANNLYTKAWRPEYKTIKTFSGFYQQEIAAHLADAELLFKEMGYKRQPNGTLLLKSTPCMDQVANVSRDALAAYVECQIMGEIYSGLVRLQCTPPSWADIYAVRELTNGDVDETIELIFERYRLKSYHTPAVEPLAVLPSVSSCSNCNGQLPTNVSNTNNNNNNNNAAYYEAPPCPQHHHLHKHQRQHLRSNNSSSMYANEHFGQANGAATAGGDDEHDLPDHAPATPSPPPPPHAAAVARYMQPQQAYQYATQFPPTHNAHQHHAHQQQQQPHELHHHPHHHPHHPSAIPHSRSLDQYCEHSTAFAEQAQKRHSSSFDQPGYECSNGAYRNAYHDADVLQPTVSAYNVSGNRFPIPDNVSSHFAAQPSHFVGGQPRQFGMVAQQQWQHSQPQLPESYAPYNNCEHGTTTTRTSNRGRVAPAAADVVAYATISGKQRSQRNTDGILESSAVAVPPQPFVSTYAQTVKQSRSANTQTSGGGGGGGGGNDSCDLIDGMEHVRILQRAPLLPTPVAHYSQQSQPQQRRTSRRSSYQQHQQHDDDAGAATNGSRTSRGISDFDSTDELAAGGQHIGGGGPNSSSSGVYASKCSDGIGSYGTWNYVYTKLEKEGYSKDLGERGNLLQDTADVSAADLPPLLEGSLAEGGVRAGRMACRNGSAAGHEPHQQLQHQLHQTIGRRSAAGGASAVKSNRDVAQSADRNLQRVNMRRKPREALATTTCADQLLAPPSNASNAVRTSQNAQPTSTTIRRNRSPAAITEWSCTQCTLLNPMSVRVCAACAHSKDFVASTAKATTTCV